MNFAALWGSLSGSKTYLSSIAGVVLAGAYAKGYISQPTMEAAIPVLISILAACLRHGHTTDIKKAQAGTLK